MKKRILPLILALAMLLCACGASKAEVEALEQRVETLEAQLAGLMVTEPVITEPVITEPVITEPVVTEPVITEPVITEPVITEPVVTEPVVTEGESEDDTENSSDMQAFLDNLLKSSDPDDWQAVAECKYANSDQLKECAKKCATLGDTWNYSAPTIANALVAHSLANGRMIEELCNSTRSDIWVICANAECNDEQSLIVLAKMCASLGDTWNYSAPTLANALIDQPLANGRMIEELCNSTRSDIWVICANAECNDEQSLIVLAKMCASLGDTWDYTAPAMANALVKHSEFSAEVALELSLSSRTDVKDIAHCALENLEKNN